MTGGKKWEKSIPARQDGGFGGEGGGFGGGGGGGFGGGGGGRGGRGQKRSFDSFPKRNDFKQPARNSHKHVNPRIEKRKAELEEIASLKSAYERVSAWNRVFKNAYEKKKRTKKKQHKTFDSKNLWHYKFYDFITTFEFWPHKNFWLHWEISLWTWCTTTRRWRRSLSVNWWFRVLSSFWILSFAMLI